MESRTNLEAETLVVMGQRQLLLLMMLGVLLELGEASQLVL